MPFCPSCRVEVQASHRFCGNCGATLPTLEAVRPTARPEIAPQPQPAPGAVIGLAEPLPYRISINRVLLMTVLSSGLYLFYWFYLTWKQYRDYTGAEAYPIWHALTLLVPVYNLFRVYAHARTFREMMTSAGLFSTISPGWAVALVWIVFSLNHVTLTLAGGFDLSAEITRGDALALAAIDVLAIALIAGLLVRVQSNLNRY